MDDRERREQVPLEQGHETRLWSRYRAYRTVGDRGAGPRRCRINACASLRQFHKVRSKEVHVQPERAERIATVERSFSLEDSWLTDSSTDNETSLLLTRADDTVRPPRRAPQVPVPFASKMASCSSRTESSLPQGPSQVRSSFFTQHSVIISLSDSMYCIASHYIELARTRLHEKRPAN